jgi:hypothetical protein
VNANRDSRIDEKTKHEMERGIQRKPHILSMWETFCCSQNLMHLSLRPVDHAMTLDAQELQFQTLPDRQGVWFQPV